MRSECGSHSIDVDVPMHCLVILSCNLQYPLEVLDFFTILVKYEQRSGNHEV